MTAVSALPPGMPAYGPAAGTARRFNEKVVSSVVLSIVALTLTVVSGVTPWWSISMTSTLIGTPTIPTTADYYLGTVCSTGGFPGLSVCFPYGGFTGLVPGFVALGNTFGVAALLMGFALLLSFLMVPFSILGALRPRTAIVNVLLRLGGAALTIGAPIFLMVALPGTLNNLGGLGGGVPVVGFWGSSTPAGTTTQWGAGPGWYLAFASAATFLVAAALAASARRSVLPLGNFRMQSPPPFSPYGPYASPYPPPMYSAPTYPSYSGFPAQLPPVPVQPYPAPIQQHSAPVSPGPPLGAPVQSWGFRRCTACGNAIASGPTICAHCGANVA